MDGSLKTLLWHQFGAAIDMLDDALRLCPNNLWETVLWKDTEDIRYGQFWFIAYHALFWLDLYLTGASEGFVPPSPFLRGRLPEQPYSKDQVCAYLNELREKCHLTIDALTDEAAARRCKFDWIEASYLEMQLYSMRHIQEHAAQLNLVLGQNDVQGMDWVTQARGQDTGEGG
jgi:hypothetical protein